MKKVVMFLSAVAMLFAVAACCGNNKKAAEAEAEATEVVEECCGDCEECMKNHQCCGECQDGQCACENAEAAEATEEVAE